VCAKNPLYVRTTPKADVEKANVEKADVEIRALAPTEKGIRSVDEPWT